MLGRQRGVGISLARIAVPPEIIRALVQRLRVAENGPDAVHCCALAGDEIVDDGKIDNLIDI